MKIRQSNSHSQSKKWNSINPLGEDLYWVKDYSSYTTAGELKPRVHNCVYKRPKINVQLNINPVNMIKENGWCTQKFLAKAEEILSNLAKRNKWEPD